MKQNSWAGLIVLVVSCALVSVSAAGEGENLDANHVSLSPRAIHLTRPNSIEGALA